MFKHKRLKIFFLFILGFLIPLPAYAYAGPGSAIGILIIILTVIIAFFSSVFIKLFNFFKMLFKKAKLNSNKHSSKNNNQKQRK